MTTELITGSLFSWLDVAGNTNTLDVDVVMATNDKRSAKLTDHVVEDGSVISDHVVIMPETVSFDLIVTETPLAADGFSTQSVPVTTTTGTFVPTQRTISVPQSRFVPGGFLALTQGLRTIVEDTLFGAGDGSVTMTGSSFVQSSASTAQASVLQSNDVQHRVLEVHDTLVDILTNALLVTIAFKGRLYVEYLLTEVELRQDPGDFGCAKFHVTARAFRTVTGVVVKLPDPADFRAIGSADKGNKPTKSRNPPEGPPAPPVSVATKLGDALDSYLHTGNMSTR